MQLKTFIGRDMQHALAQVKRELGPEAVILSTHSRQVLGPAAQRQGRREIEVVAGFDRTCQASEGATSFFGPPLPRSSATRKDPHRGSEGKPSLSYPAADELFPTPLARWPELADFQRNLLRLGIKPPVLEKWLHHLEPLLAHSRGKVPGKPEAMQALAQVLPITDPWQVPANGPRRWVFLGSTGVGKTTTLAKLAVDAALIRGQKVGLISLDQQRLGAVEQLDAVARLIDLPRCFVSGRAELARALNAFEGLDLVLMDTPGQSPFAPRLVEELHTLFGNLPHLACHLVVQAGSSESLIAATLQNFGVIPLTSVILSKVDETRNLVDSFNQLCLSGLPLSFLTTGQRIPEDLEPASGSRIAAWLMGATGENSPSGAAPGAKSEVIGYAGR